MSKQALKIKMTPIIDKINKRTKDIPILNNTQKVLIPAKCWNIGDKKCYVRAGFPITGNRKCIYLCNYPMGDNRFRIIQATQEKRRIHHRTHSLSLCHRRSFPNLDKALYLDADLVINGSIEPLWELDLEGYYCAGVDDIFIRRINYRKILELAEKDVYINAGVLLLNLKDLRKDKIQEKLLQHTSIYINRDRYQDQDAINCICKGKIKLIPNIYNSLPVKLCIPLKCYPTSSSFIIPEV